MSGQSTTTTTTTDTTVAATTGTDTTTDTTTAATGAVRIPLSHTQEFLVAFDKGDEGGPFGPRYHNTRGLRLTGEIDTAVLRAALHDVVERHEALRTLVVRTDGEPYQQVLPPVPAELVETDLADVPGSDRDRRAEEFLIEVEAGTLAVDHPPLLRAHLGRFDGRDAVLVLIAHHVATDGWSMRVIVRDLALCYARRAGQATDPPVAPQYREYTADVRGERMAALVERATPYWRDKLDGARMLGIEMDRPRSTDAVKVTSTYRFVVDPELASATMRFAALIRGSAFMVLMSAYGILLYRRTGTADVVVPTISAGRTDQRYENTVGPFFNFIPLRTDLTGARTLHDVVTRTRATCIEAQTNEIPFAYIAPQAPDLMATFAADNIGVGAMQVFQHPFGGTGDLGSRATYTELRRRLMFQPVSSNIPDGILWTLDVDPADGIFGAVKFNRNEFDTSTIEALVGEFQDVLRAIVTRPQAPLATLVPQAVTPATAG